MGEKYGKKVVLKVMEMDRGGNRYEIKDRCNKNNNLDRDNRSKELTSKCFTSAPCSINGFTTRSFPPDDAVCKGRIPSRTGSIGFLCDSDSDPTPVGNE